MVEYRVSLGCNFLLANAIGLFSPALSSWSRTAIGGFGIGAVRKIKMLTDYSNGGPFQFTLVG